MFPMAGPIAQRVAANVAAHLAARDITQAELAVYLYGTYDNTSRNRTWRRVAGDVAFSPDELAKIAAYLDVTVDSLTAEDDAA